MNIHAYLTQQKQRIADQAQQVRDFAVFDFSHVPEQPVMRDECRELIDAMLRFDASGIPSHLAIVGARGSGKTLTLKYLQRLIPDQTALRIHYANCRHHNTSYRIFAHLLGGQCAGASLSELFQRFQARSGRKTVLVLDEVDLMSPKDKRREILYLLSRAEKPCMLVLLSNSPQLLKQLDAATRSSLQPIPMHFRNYDAEQIRLILEDRARRGLHRWNDAALRQIAALTVRLTNADARVAIKTLYYHVTRPDQALADCFESARRDIVIDMIHDLADHPLAILWAAATASSELARSIYDRYARFAAEQKEKPFSYVHFYATLSYLQSMGLLALISTKQGRTYTNRVMLTFDPEVATSVAGLRFG